MAELETIHLSHLPPEFLVYAGLYRDVTNAGFLKEQLLAGNEAFEYAFIDASMILSRQHALAAVFRALNDYLNDRLKSRNVHSEIVFALSSNNNIGEAFRRFGVSDTTKNLLVFKVATAPQFTAESVQSHLTAHVKGEAIPFNDEQIEPMTDLTRIKKVHKLGTITMPGGGGGGGGKRKAVTNGDNQDSDRVHVSVADERKTMEVQVLGLMALRGAT